MSIVFYRQRMFARIQQLQSSLNIGDPDSTMIDHLAAIDFFFRIESFKKHLVITPGQGYLYFVQFIFTVTNVFKTVFNEGNEYKWCNHDASHIFGNLQLDG